MKKLMTMLSAVAVAIGLQAADTGTSFEGLTAGELDFTSTTGELSGGPGFWAQSGSVTGTYTVVEGVSLAHEGGTPIIEDWKFDNVPQAKYLNIQTTFGNALKRNVNANGAPLDLDGAYYFDSLVKFTAFDLDPTELQALDFTGAKIAVWLKETNPDGAGNTTNLYIYAGNIGGSATPYDCGDFSVYGDPSGWHRLTIKAIENIYASGECPGFVVFVDNTIAAALSNEYNTNIVKANLDDKYLGAYNAKALFPSMIQSGSDATQIASVSFDGQGDIDDIVFTADQPFAAAADSDPVYANFAGVDYPSFGEAIATANVSTVSGTLTLLKPMTSGKIAIDNGNGVTITIELNGQTVSGGIEADSDVVVQDTVGGAKIEGASYFTDDSVITGGAFNATTTDDPAELSKCVKIAGKAFVAGTGDWAGYWVIGDRTYAVEVNGVGYATIDAALTAATAGQTVKLNEDVEASSVSTAAGTIDLNGKTLTLSGTTEVTFTGTGAKTLKGGDLTGVYHELTITAPAGENLTFDGMTFHASVKPHGSGALFTATNCRFLCDYDKTGAAFTDGSSADVHSYGLLFDSNTLFAQADVVNNYFDQGRRAAVQASIGGDLYFYGNTVVADKLTSRVDGAGTRYPALQIISNGGVFIENNSFSGQYLGEAFCVYNKGTYRTTGAPIVFSGNTVANDVTYLWGIYDVDASGAAALVNPDIYFGANTIGANVDLEHCIYKTTVDGIDMNGVTYTYAQNLALPAGVASIYAWTHAAGAKPYYVDGVAADAVSAGTVIAVPGVAVASDTCILTADATLKNQYTAVAAAAKVGNTLYATFKEAVEAAPAGATVEVLDNCTEPGMVTITAGITISNNYTVALTGMYALRFANGSTPVTICGTGTLAGSGEGSPLLIGSNETTKNAKYKITTTYEGSVILDGNTITYSGSGNVIKVEYGTFTMNSGTVTAGGNRGVKADADVGNFTSTVIINGGAITSTKAAVAVSADTGTASGTINGGNITGPLSCGGAAGTATLTIPGTSTAKFSAEPAAAYVESGYETVLSDGWYVVQAIPSYTITFISGEGSTTNTLNVQRGAEVVAPTAAEVVGKTFDSWDPAVVTPAAGNAEYRAVYTVNTYAIKFVYGENLATTSTVTTAYGVVPTAPSAETVAVAGKNFDGWDKTVVAATADAIYIAQYSDAAPAVQPIVPAEGGSTEYSSEGAAIDARDAINKNPSAYITAPAGVTDTAAYYSKVEAKVVPGTDGKYCVVLEVAEAAKPAVKAAAETSAAAVVNGKASAVTVSEGLYYKVTTDTSVAFDSAEGKGKTTTSGLSSGSVPVTKPGLTQGFIKVEVDAKPIQ